MGAEFNITLLKAKDKAEAVEKGKAKIKQALYDSGHGGYSGTWAECTGVVMTDEVFDTRLKGEEWLRDNAEKWGPMLIVQIVEEGEVPFFMAGAWCSS